MARQKALRVTHVVRRYPVLSQTFVSNEVAELRRQGVDVTVLALWPSDDVGEAAPDLVLGSTRVTRVALWAAVVRLGVTHPVRLARFVRLRQQLCDEPVAWLRLPWLAAILRRRTPDVFHAHFAWESASVAWALGLLLGKPWSMTIHANDMFSDPSHLESKLAGADAVVTVCDYNIYWLRGEAKYVGPIEKVICGVELPTQASPSSEPKLDVLAIGRLVEKKGFDTLIAAIGELIAGGAPVTCEIIGEGPLRAQLHSMVAAAGISERVTLTGEMPNSTVLERISDARVVCIPSRVAADGDRDSMPVVAKEAMARFVPVVGTTVGGIPEMVDDSCGVVVPPDDASALAGALALLLNNEEERLRRGRNARRRVEERFTLSGEVGKLRSVFEALVDGG